jgi:endonuclease YncB( thermonuclease family)
LSINNPRRIFRSSIPLRGVALIALVGSLVAVGVVLTARPRQTSGNAVPVPGTEIDRLDALPGQAAVVDGGTLVLRNRVVRLLGVEPPPRGMLCRTTKGADIDCAAAAARALAALVWDVPVACEVHGRDEMGRPYAVCAAGGTDLSRALVAAGWVRANDALATLKRVEDQARAGHRGLWAGR